MRDSTRTTADFYSALLRTHGAILRARERDPLLQEICSICIDAGAATLAFVALVRDGTAHPVAWAGSGDAFLDGLEVPLDPRTPEGQGPLACAIRTGIHSVCNDVQSDPRTLPWRDRTAGVGSRAMAAFPIRRDGTVVGALSLHVAQKDFFDEPVIGLLDAMAADISYALDNFARETARVHAVRAAAVGDERFEKIFHAAPVAIVIATLREGRLMAVNDAYCTLLGHARGALVGRTSAEIGVWLEPAARAAFVTRLTREHRVRDLDLSVRVASGGLRNVAMSAELIDFEGEACLLAILNDVTDRKRYEARIEFLATHDALTELPNRTLMLDRITQALQHARRTDTKVAVLHVDVDRFKIINESLGQQGGDRVLATVGSRLRAAVRDGDTVARFGSDEFTVLLPDLVKLGDCYNLVQRILADIAVPVDVNGRTIRAHASIGISVFPTDGDTPELLLSNADAAMLRAKRITPGGCQFFTAEMSAELRSLAQLESRLSGALAANQLRLVYQPKVELAGGTIAGVEALLRWRHPDLGDVPPATFIPVAEEGGAIVPIGAWVLERACAQNMAWQAAGLPALPISVNVSARQFLQPDLVTVVAAALHSTRMPGSLLELEITETAITRNAGRMTDIMSLLRELGVRFSIDDFGTGYSNLGYLKRFELDRLKIDQSFVRNVDTDASDAAMARAVIAMARSLQLEVTAEGVETAGQYEFMKRNTCDEIQGFYFSKAVPADTFARMLREGRRLH